MTQAETSVEKHLRLWVKSVGGQCIKLPAVWYRGIPDRLVLLPGGRVWFVELKRYKGRTTNKVAAGQSAWETFLLYYGFNYTRLFGMDQAKEFINDRIKDTV